MRPAHFAADPLHRLIEALRRCEETFRVAASCASSAPLRVLLADLAAQRFAQTDQARQWLRELTERRVPARRPPPPSPEPAAISVPAEARGDAHLLEGCHRCDGRALAACDEVLAAGVSQALRGFIEDQQRQLALARQHGSELLQALSDAPAGERR